MSEKYKEWATIYFAPGVLILVACLQLFLAQTQGLTPWKGGGFGMFSTVDSGGARFLRIYLVTGSQAAAVQLPASDTYTRLEADLSEFPRQRLLDQLAARLATEKWVPGDYDPFGTGLAAQPKADQPVYRVAYEGEPLPETGPVALQTLRVELWRYRFDAKTGLIQAYKYMESQQVTGN